MSEQTVSVQANVLIPGYAEASALVSDFDKSYEMKEGCWAGSRCTVD